MIKKYLPFLCLLSFLQAEMLPLHFTGNERIKERELYTVLNLHKPYGYEFWADDPKVDPKSAALLTETIKNYYRYKGFFHTIVTFKEHEKSFEITIDEKAPIKVTNITVKSNLDISALNPFSYGMIFDSEKFEKSKKEIKEFYANQGYCHALLESKAWIDVELNSADIMYEVVSDTLCYFGTIKIQPAVGIDTDIISSFMYIKEGDIFAPEAVRQSYQSLYGREGIKKAMIETTIYDTNKVLVDVAVTQAEKPIRFQSGIGASSDLGAMFSLGIKHRNFLGNLRTLSMTTRLTQVKQNIKTIFNMPLANRNATGFEVGFENEAFSGFKEQRILGSIFIKQQDIPHSYQQSLLLDRTNTYASEDSTLFPEGSLFVLSPKIEWGYDTRDNILDPKKGLLLHTELMGSLQAIVSNASYYKYKLSGAYIIPILPTVLALKAEYGGLHLFDGTLPSSYRFYAGGMNSNRAYLYRQLGVLSSSGDPIGLDSILDLSIEYRFPIYGNFRGIVFNDTTFIGEVDYPNYEKGYYSLGFGLRYMTPIGPIALDAGFDIKDPQAHYALHFHIGELF